MIKTQIIRESNNPIAVILDYEEYQRLKVIEQNKEDYDSALKVKQENKRWVSHNDLKREFALV